MDYYSLITQNIDQVDHDTLKAICLDLQDKVSKSIKVEQTLIQTRNDLDAELNRFRLMQEFGDMALRAKSVEAVGEITAEYFSAIFNLPKIAIYQFFPNQREGKLLCSFGFSHDVSDRPLEIPIEKVPAGAMIFPPIRACGSYMEFLGLSTFVVGPMFNPGEQCIGLIVAGATAEDAKYFDPIDEKVLSSFNVMTRNAGLILQHIFAAFQLEQEIEERKAIEIQLRQSQQALEYSNEELEWKVKQRTNELMNANAELQKEIEDRKNIERQLAERAAELMRSNADLEQFAYVASHDLKAPIRNISSFVQLLQLKLQDLLDEETTEYMQFTVSAVHQINNLIDDLLTYARLGQHESPKGLVDLNQTLEVVQEHLLTMIEEQHAHIHYQGLPFVKANAVQMVQLFKNLVENAIKFRKENSPPVIQITAEQHNGYHRILVCDNGIGIAPEYCDKIFTIFHRLNPSNPYGGTGVGLAICKRIMERHSGHIWVESHQGNGSCFFLELPVE